MFTKAGDKIIASWLFFLWLKVTSNFSYAMAYPQNSQSNFFKRQFVQASNADSTRESCPVLEHDYARKIALDSVMVGSLPMPRSSANIPGIIKTTESYDCTHTTQSNFCKTRTFPYSDYVPCRYCSIFIFSMLLSNWLLLPYFSRKIVFVLPFLQN